jgi:hypothetical protein
MRSDEFWTYFSNSIKPQLAGRAETFQKIFEYMDQFDRPVGIVETGCVRVQGNWGGDGGSTLLFDAYAKAHPGSVVYSVDLSVDAVTVCRSMVSPCVKVHNGDSVAFLKNLADQPPADLPTLDLLYLDSYDVDLENPGPSAIHHLKELAAISPSLNPKTLVVLDDSPMTVIGVTDNVHFGVIGKPKIGGKGKYVAEYAEQIGAEPLFTAYQCGWTKFRK